MIKATILLILVVFFAICTGCSTTTEQGVTVQRPWYSDAQPTIYPVELLS